MINKYTKSRPAVKRIAFGNSICTSSICFVKTLEFGFGVHHFDNTVCHCTSCFFDPPGGFLEIPAAGNPEGSGVLIGSGLSGFIVSLCFSLGWWMAVWVRVSNDEIRHFRHCFLSVAVQGWGSPSLTHTIPFQCLMCDQYGSPLMYYSIGPCWIGKTHDVH